MNAVPAAVPAAPSTLPAVTHTGPTAPPRQPWHWRLWQLFMAYLPMVLMAALALGTWWLVRNIAVPASAPRTTTPRHEPDYEMRQFAVQRYSAQGGLRVHIEGEVLRHFPDTDTLEISKVRIRSVAADGRVTVATAQQAVSNGEGTEVELRGQAEVVREASAGHAGIRFQSEFLHAFLEEERVLTDKPVTITQGETVLRSDRMEYTKANQVIRFGGRTHASFAPRSGP